MTTTFDMIADTNDTFTEIGTVAANSTRTRLYLPAALPSMALLISVCLLLNPIVMVVIVAQKNLHKPVNTFICSLAFIDFLDGCIPMLGLAVSAASTTYRYEMKFCRTMLVFDQALSFAGLVHLLLLAYDRYCAVVHPLKYSMPNRKLIIAVQIACTYAAVFVIWIVPVMSYSTLGPLGACYLALPVYLDISQIILIYFMTYVAVLCFYGRCVWGIWTQFYRVRPRGDDDNNDDSVRGKKESLKVSSNLSEAGTSMSKTNNTELFSTSPVSEATSTVVTTDAVWTSGQASSTSSRSTGSTRIPAGNSSNKRRNDLVRSLRNVGAYVVAFSILIMPYAMVKIVQGLCILVDVANSCAVQSLDLAIALDWLPYIHSAVHPLLFMTTQRDFWASCRQLFKRIRTFLHL